MAVAHGKLSVIIVGWNCLDEVRTCLRSLAAHPPAGDVEVIYVDNASSDGSAAAIRSTFPHVTVIALDRNRGFQAGNNAGLRVATGNEILLLNPDTRVLPGSLDRLFGFLRSRPDVGAASPRCVYPDGRVQWTMAPFPSLPIIRHWFATTHRRAARLMGLHPRGSGASAPEPATQEQAYAYGACLATTRAVVEAVGLMDERYFLAGGEIAWSREMQRQGWKTWYVAEATIEHRESTTRRRRGVVAELDWIAAHRRLLYTCEGLRAGLIGDVIFSVHLILIGIEALVPSVLRGGRASGAAGSVSA